MPCLCEKMNFAQLLRLSEPKRVLRARTVRGPSLKVESFKDTTYYIFNFKSFPSTTGLRHKGYIKFLKPKKVMPLEKIDCIVDCTCFAGDAPVLMADGCYKPISEVVPGDQVYTHKGRIRTVLGNVERPLREGEKVFSLSVALGTPVTVTGNHPYYVLREGEFHWVPVSALVESDRLFFPYSVSGGTFREFTREPSDYSGTVWDLCVEEDESFIVAGAAVHNCPDYRYRFAWVLKQKGAGVVGDNSLNQAHNRAPRKTNPRGNLSLCKHLAALSEFVYGQYENFDGERPDSSARLDYLVKYARNRWIDSSGQPASAPTNLPSESEEETPAPQPAAKKPEPESDDLPVSLESLQDGGLVTDPETLHALLALLEDDARSYNKQ